MGPRLCPDNLDISGTGNPNTCRYPWPCDSVEAVIQQYGQECKSHSMGSVCLYLLPCYDVETTPEKSEEVLIKLGPNFSRFAHMDEYLIYQVCLLPSVVLIPVPILTYSLSYKHLYPLYKLGETTVVLGYFEDRSGGELLVASEYGLVREKFFRCTEQLFSAGKITDTRVAELKEQYTMLYEAVISLQESETQLLQEAERLSAELEQQCELEKAEQLPEEASSEASQIKQQLFSCRSEYNAIKGRVYENRLKIECLREEKKLLENEYEKMSKEKKNNKIEQLKENCDQLSKEVIQKKAEVDSIKEAVSSKEKLILTDEEEMEKLQEMQTYLKAELVRLLGVPKQLAKETEKLIQKKIDAEKKNEALNDQIEELNSTLKATEKRTEEILQEKEDVMKEMDERQTLIQKNERECINLTKVIEINAEKELAILADRLQGFTRMCDLMLIEKDKSIDLMRIAQWKAREAENRVKLLENNIQNLRDAVITRERKLQDEYLKIKKNERIKELIKKDYSKIEQEMIENKEKEKYLNIDRLTAAATHIEEEILQLRKNYERAIEQRNERYICKFDLSGLLLKEREEELGFLYEKINRQEVLCRNGDTKMQVMDEKISFLKLKLVEKKREVKLCFKELTVKNDLDAHLVRLRIQYSQCRDKIKKLEENYGDATNESRKQEMGGKDPSPPELLKRIEKIEAELVQKEQRLLKIDFLCENISDMIDRIRAVVENSKQDMLVFARRTNELQRKINHKTQEIKALFAELSMKQALAIKLHQEIRDKEQFLMTSSMMISQGLPPPKAEKERWKTLCNEKIQKAAAEARAKDTMSIRSEAARNQTAEQDTEGRQDSMAESTFNLTLLDTASVLEMQPAEEKQGAVPSQVPTIPEEEDEDEDDDEEEEGLPLVPAHMTAFRPSEPRPSPRHFKKPPAKPFGI
ncbi:Coiled-coil domain-containing protein 146 [Lonchura striata]|uniref:Coiled-coil domain-containing protein 146 n=1 Tax=Lonchura striata TaxID=40157 RepID=A0A218UAY8_9PASE|nr:Coiled-coil domain-containing protein 146 [Lonchura striata domestica]